MFVFFSHKPIYYVTSVGEEYTSWVIRTAFGHHSPFMEKSSMNSVLITCFWQRENSEGLNQREGELIIKLFFLNNSVDQGNMKHL